MLFLSDMPDKHADLKIVKISKGKEGKCLATFDRVNLISTMDDIKTRLAAKIKMQKNRMSFRTGTNSKQHPNLKDDVTLGSLDIRNDTLYIKDLGPQISWTVVFLTEYAGPLLLYLIFYFRLLPWVYGLGTESFGVPNSDRTVYLAMLCHTGHRRDKKIFLED